MGFSPIAAKNAAARAFNAFNIASFVIGAKAANTINVAVTLKDARGRALQAPVLAKVYLSDNADGSTLTATVTTSAIAVQTNGVVLATLTSGKYVEVLTNGAGLFDINVVQTASPVTYYMVVVLPDGSIAVSGAITF